MKIKRVGTITLAVALIALGVLIFISQINNVYTLDLALKLWPIILILLGVEILWCRFGSKDEEVVVKYDILSILLVFVILFTNLTLYAMLEIGVIERIRELII